MWSELHRHTRELIGVQMSLEEEQQSKKTTKWNLNSLESLLWKSQMQAAEDARAAADTASRKKHLLQEQTKTRIFSLSRRQPTSGKEKLMASGSSQNQNNAKKGAGHLGKITRVQCMCKTCAHCSRGSKTSRKSCRRRYDWRNPTIRVEFMAPLGFRYKIDAYIQRIGWRWGVECISL